MDIIKLQYEAACIANENALAVFKEAEADAERASKDVAKAKKIEHAAHVWASIAEAKLEDTIEIMEAKRKAINKLKSKN